MNFAPHSPLARDLGAVEYIDAIARLGWPDHDVCGDVHGIGHDQFASLHAAFGETFKGGHLVGHPVPRLAGSLYFSREIGRVWKHAEYLAMWGMEPTDARAQTALAVLGEDGDHIPAHYMINVNSITSICGPDGPLAEPIFKLEALMTQDAEWERMIDHFSGGAVAYGDTWRELQGVIMGSAHQPFASGDPQTAWDGLPDYAQRMMAAALTPQSRAAFEALGYDLSFIR